eukprot:374501_1
MSSWTREILASAADQIAASKFDAIAGYSVGAIYVWWGLYDGKIANIPAVLAVPPFFTAMQFTLWKFPGLPRKNRQFVHVVGASRDYFNTAATNQLMVDHGATFSEVQDDHFLENSTDHVATVLDELIEKYENAK